MQSISNIRSILNLSNKGSTVFAPTLNLTEKFLFNESLTGVNGTVATFSRTGSLGWNPETFVLERNNIILQSNNFTTTWAATQTPVLTQNQTDPFGVANSAWTIQDDNATNVEGITQSVTLASGTQYVFSVYAKKTSGATTFPVIAASRGTSLAICTIDTNGGAATAWTAYTGQTVVTSSATISDSDTGFWRVALKFTPDTSGNWSHAIFPAAASTANKSSGTYDATIQGTNIFFGAQLNPLYLTDYLQTTTAVATNPRYISGKSGKSILMESLSSNYFLNSEGTACVTQNIAVTTANSGKWTCTVWGAGTVTSSGGANATGYGAASAGTSNTITATGNETVTYTVSGADATTRVQVENKVTLPGFSSSWIKTEAATQSRGADLLSVPLTGLIGTSAGTISCWINATAAGSWNSATAGAEELFQMQTASNTNAMRLFKSSNTITFRINNSATTQYNAPTSPALSVGWHNLTMVYDFTNTIMRFYVDGVEMGSGTVIAGSYSAIPSSLSVASFSATSNWCDSLPIDGLYFYNRALTAAEVKQLYNAGGK